MLNNLLAFTVFPYTNKSVSYTTMDCCTYPIDLKESLLSHEMGDTLLSEGFPPQAML